ncbi:MAG: hypothetical protein Ct9H300mP28_23470 [Pseudomonadota bacterium]|nr:MAG: hypothetical protein Ct9H300mP28_23470 [Pseudomonadota bacterium]
MGKAWEKMDVKLEPFTIQYSVLKGKKLTNINPGKKGNFVS